MYAVAGSTKRHAGLHQLSVNSRTNFRFHIGQLLARVDAGEFRRVGGNPRLNFFVFTERTRNRNYICQVVLLLRVGRLQFRERGSKQTAIDDVTAGVDFLDGALGGRRVAVLDDFVDVAGRVANDAAVCGGIVEHDTDEGELGAALSMCVEESAQRRRRDSGHVAVSDQHVAGEVCGKLAEGASHGVARTALRLLERKSHLRGVRGGFDFARLVADDDHDGVGLQRGECTNSARDHRLSAKLVQDLGALRAHPGSLAGGENDRCEAIRSHRSSRLSTYRPLCAP